MSSFKKINSTLVTVLALGVLSSASQPVFADENNQANLTSQVNQAMDQVSDSSDIEATNVEFDTEENTLTVSSEFDNETTSGIIENEDNTYSADTTIDLGSDEATVVTEESGTEITYDLSNMSVSSEGVSFDYTATNGESGHYDSENGNASLVWAALPGLMFASAALAALYVAGALILIAGVAYIVATKAIPSIISAQKKGKAYNHYAASLSAGKLWIGKGIKEATAVSRLRGGGSTWSISQHNAKTVASKINSSGVVRERDSSITGKYWHYHAKNRKPKGAHAFYGTAG